MNNMRDRSKERAVLEAKALLVMRAAKTAFEAIGNKSSLKEYHLALKEAFERCHIQYQLTEDGHYTCFKSIDVRLAGEQGRPTQTKDLSHFELPGELVISVGQEKIVANFYQHYSDSLGAGDTEEKR